MIARPMRKRLFGLAAATLLILVLYLIPNPEGLSQQAKMAITLMLAGLILWLTEAMPNGISAILLMALMPYFGIFTFSELWTKFMSSAWFFILASFGLTIALGKTSIPKRISAKVLKTIGAKPERIVLGFMTIAALISTICSNIAAVTMMVGFSVGLLKANNCKPKESRFGRCLIIGVTYGSLIGGCATLCGGSSHIMLLSITEANFGFSVKFLDWIIVSLPLVALLLPITWFSLIKIYKPEPLDPASVKKMVSEVESAGPMPAREKGFLVFLLVLFSCWIASTWVGTLNLTVVALIGLAFMFVPGVDFLSWKDFGEGVSWNLLLVIGGVIALTAGISATGGMTWVVDQVAPFFASLSDTAIYLFCSLFACIVHCVVPSGSATAGICALPLMELAKATGANPTAIFHIIGWWAGGTFLMPIDSLLLLVYSFGYTELKDPVKAGVVPTIALIVLSSTLTPWICTTFNIGMPLI